MQEVLTAKAAVASRRLRAIIEVRDGEIHVQPIADTDEEERRIIDGLRFFTEAWRER